MIFVIVAPTILIFRRVTMFLEMISGVFVISLKIAHFLLLLSVAVSAICCYTELSYGRVLGEIGASFTILFCFVLFCFVLG